MVAAAAAISYSLLLAVALAYGAETGRNKQHHLAPPAMDFTLKHIHLRGLGVDYRAHKRLDIPQAYARNSEIADTMRQSYRIGRTIPGHITTLAEHSHDSLSAYLESQHSDRRSNGSTATTSFDLRDYSWIDRDIPLPNITDRGTILTLAAMTSNCYTPIPHTGDWIDLDDGFNSSGSFGWEDDGLRGHVFSNDDSTNVVLAFKGTSLLGNTSRKDKRMDNLLFSCCCARVSYLWRTVCDCYEDTFTCNMTCLERELRSKKAYYHAALDIYHNVSTSYPNASIWLVGHSLGGAIASLVAQTYALPAVTFQAPGEKLAATRLGLPLTPRAIANQISALGHERNPNNTFADNIWAFGHTADPLYMGTCGGITSLCWSAGFAMETHCHSGLECVYDVVNDLGWRQGVNTHRILTVINDVIPKYNTTPTCTRTDDCVDCFNWNNRISF